ncbi:MAG: GNAT family N-acetyltransferase [Clostridia bacterium]|nr:GNAT family N-acetyltransferase [Clostridia bacterium]
MTLSDLTLRKLTFDDKPQMMRLQDEVLAALPDPRWFFPSEEWEFDFWLQGDEAIGYFDGDRLAGYAAITAGVRRGEHSYARVLGLPPEGTYDFHDVLVRPDYRGLGIHTQFLQLFTDMVRAEGGHAIYATVDPENGSSWRNFERAGYECILVQPAYDGRMRRYYRLSL